jgi:hypothetical protein
MASILEEIDTKLFNLLDIRIRPMTRGGEADKIGTVRFFRSKFLADNYVFVVDPYPDPVGSAFLWRIRIGIQGLLIRIRIRIHFNLTYR